MATNRKYAAEANLSLPVPEGTVSGSPVVVGKMNGVALIDRDTAGNATVDVSDAVYSFPVAGAAIAAGGYVYAIAASGGNPATLTATASGNTIFGVAPWGTAGSGAAALVKVLPIVG